jgi:hypothetical protein
VQDQRGLEVTNMAKYLRLKKILPVPGREKNILDISFHRTRIPEK